MLVLGLVAVNRAEYGATERGEKPPERAAVDRQDRQETVPPRNWPTAYVRPLSPRPPKQSNNGAEARRSMNVGGDAFLMAYYGTEELDLAAGREIADYLGEPRRDGEPPSRALRVAALTSGHS